MAAPAYASSDCAGLNFQTLFFSGSSQIVFFQTLDAGDSPQHLSVTGTPVSGSLQIKADSTIAATLTARRPARGELQPAGGDHRDHPRRKASTSASAAASSSRARLSRPGCPGPAATAAGQLASNAHTAIAGTASRQQFTADRHATGSSAVSPAASRGAGRPTPRVSIEIASVRTGRAAPPAQAMELEPATRWPRRRRSSAARSSAALAALQGNEKYARVTADILLTPPSAEAPRDKQPDARPTSFGLGQATSPSPADAACDPLEREVRRVGFNAWSVPGVVDSQAAEQLCWASARQAPASTTGSSPRSALAGLAGVAVENFEIQARHPGPLRTGSTGVSALPYIAVQGSTATFMPRPFVGLTAIDYNANLAPTPWPCRISRRALRVFFGGALSGVWRDGAPRLPAVARRRLGERAQAGYTTSDGAAVQGVPRMAAPTAASRSGPGDRPHLQRPRRALVARRRSCWPVPISTSARRTGRIVNGFATIVRPGSPRPRAPPAPASRLRPSPASRFRSAGRLRDRSSARRPRHLERGDPGRAWRSSA